MSDDQQIIVPANRPDECSTEQPPKCDVDAAAACPVQPPKDEDAAAAFTVQSPNGEAEIMDVVMTSQDDNVGSAAPPPNNDAGLTSPPNIDAGQASPPKEDASSAPPPKDDAIPAPPPKEDVISAPLSKKYPITGPLSKKYPIAAPLSKKYPIAGPKSKKYPIAGPKSKKDVGAAGCADVTIPLERKRPKLQNMPGCSNAIDDDCAGFDFKKEIKHETYDLGDDTYFYDNNNKAILIKGRPKVGFDRGLEPDHIVGATEEDGKLMFLIAWKNSEVADLLDCNVVYDRAPQIAIEFFESRLRYCTNNSN